MPQYVEVGKDVIEFPDGMSDADIAKALGGQGSAPASASAPAAPAAPAADARSTATRLYQDYVAKPVTSALSKAVTGNFDRPELYPAAMKDVAPAMATEAKAKADAGSEFVVPQTPTQAAIMAGTMGGGIASRGATPGMGALMRILGGATGGAIGGGLEDESLAGAGKGAAIGGATTAASEAAGALLSKVLRSRPGAKGAIAAQDAMDYATEMGRQVPTLRGAARTPEELRALSAGPGQQMLGDAKERVVQQIERALGGRGLRVPSVDARINTVPTAPAMRGAYGEELLAPQTAQQPATMSLRAANDALSEIGARAFSKIPTERNFNGVDQRQLYGRIREEIMRALSDRDPRLATMWNDAQRQYEAGLGLLRPLQSPKAWRTGSGLQFNTPAVQRSMAAPKVENRLRDKLGDPGFESLRDTVLRGGRPGDADVLAPGSGGMLQATGEMMRGKGGATQLAAWLPRTLFPNAGSHYAGTRQPYQVAPSLQTLLDLLGIRGAGRAAGE